MGGASDGWSIRWVEHPMGGASDGWSIRWELAQRADSLWERRWTRRTDRWVAGSDTRQGRLTSTRSRPDTPPGGSTETKVPMQNA
jgi:hypothetical protein